MDLQKIRDENFKKLQSGQNREILSAIEALQIDECDCDCGDVVRASFNASAEQRDEILRIARALKPWRKGPFALNDLFIDAEWRSFVKFNLLRPFLNLSGKTVADVGCNNGYYMFRASELAPARLVGFDPSALFYLQFSFIEKFLRSGAKFELLGVEHLPFYEHKFDTIFCLGVIYHRSDPVKMLKDLRASLNAGGEVFLDTMYIEGAGDFALCPKNSYSKISNIYFVPTVGALQNWCERAKFRDFEILAQKPTDASEQRKTEWIDGQSLENFLDPLDGSRTIEGYPAPRRIYVRLRA